MQGAFREVLGAFVYDFSHGAATADALLCYLAAELASLPVSTIARHFLDCAIVRGVQQSDEPDDENTRGGGGLQHDPPPPPFEGKGKLESAERWLRRLQAWLHTPGVPVVELSATHSASEAAPGESGGGGPAEVQDDFWQLRFSHVARPYQV